LDDIDEIKTRGYDKDHLITMGYSTDYSNLDSLSMDKWNTIMLKLKMNHTPYDCRHTFATRMDNVSANKVCIKLIMGHQIKDITDVVYTHKTKEQLIEQVNLLK